MPEALTEESEGRFAPPGEATETGEAAEATVDALAKAPLLLDAPLGLRPFGTLRLMFSSTDGLFAWKSGCWNVQLYRDSESFFF